MPGSAERDVVVLAASVPFDGQRLSEQHLALALAAAGHQVLYLDPPRSAWKRDSAGPGGRPLTPLTRSVRDVTSGLTVLSLTVPPGGRRSGLQPATDRWRTLLANRVLSRRRQLPAAVLSAAGRPSVFTGYGKARKVFWAKDDYVAGAGLIGLDAERIQTGQLATGRIVDAAVAVTPGLEQLWRTRVDDCTLIPAGSDPTMAAASAAASPPDVGLESPVVGFVGQISDRMDLGLIESIADSGVSVLLVGRRQPSFGSGERFATLVARPNVCWVGARTYAELPAYLDVIDVGLIPYTDSAFNRASFPLKLLEYLSVGAAVVSTDLPAARWLDSAEVIIASAQDFGSSVAEQVALAASGGAQLAAARDRRRSVAAEHTWTRRAEQFAAALHLAP